MLCLRSAVKMVAATVLFAICAAALSQTTGELGQSTAGVWERCADVPWAVQEVYGTVRDGKLIIAGGMRPSADGVMEALDRTGVYDPLSNTWTEGPSLPTALHHPMLVSVAGRVYAFGGFTASKTGFWNASRQVYVLERNGEWLPLTQMPGIQTEAMLVEHEGRIHIIGGRSPLEENSSRWTQYRDVDWHQVYDINTDTWSKAAPLPAPRNSAAVAIIDGLIYIAGGRTMRGGNTADLQRYDPRHDRWETLAPMPYAGGGINGAAAGGYFYVFGGEKLGVPGAEGVLPHAVRYHPASNQWQTLPDMPNPRHGHAVVAIGGMVFAVGGGAHTSGGLTTSVLEVFRPAGAAAQSCSN